MKKTYLVSGFVVLAAATTAWAQPGGFGGPGGPGGRLGGGFPPHPLSVAIDANDDGEITLEEFSDAKKIFATLDKDENGKLTEDELRPRFGGRGGDGGVGGPGGRGGGFGGRGGRGAGGGNNSPLETWMSLDKNNDGKLEKSEVSPRMQTLITRADENKDGVATKEELAKLADSESSAAGRGRGDRGGPGAQAEGRGGRGGRGGFGGGPPSSEDFIERAMSFDADKNGQLNKEELAKMASELMSRFGGRQGGRGGPDGGGRGGFGGPGGGGPGGGRGGFGGRGGGTQRPARPE